MTFLSGAIRNIARYIVNKCSVTLQRFYLLHIVLSYFIHLFQKYLELLLVDWSCRSSWVNLSYHVIYIVKHLVNFFDFKATFLLSKILVILQVSNLLSLGEGANAWKLPIAFHTLELFAEVLHEFIIVLYFEIPRESLHVICSDPRLLSL